MRPDKEDAKLSRVIRAWAVETRQGLDAHPENEILLAYYDGELGAAEAESLRDHLAWCPDCSQRGLDLETFSQLNLVEDDGLAAQATELAWAATHQALEESEQPSELHEAYRSVTRAWRPLFYSLWKPGYGYATAALFFVVSLGLSLRLIDVLTVLEQPRVDVQVVDLQPIETGMLRDVGSSRAAPTVVKGTPLVLVLYLLDPGLYTSYRVEILDSAPPDERVMWSADDLARSPEDDFTVLLPSSLLTEGNYRVRLHGVESGQLHALAEYALRVERE